MAKKKAAKLSKKKLTPAERRASLQRELRAVEREAARSKKAVYVGERLRELREAKGWDRADLLRKTAEATAYDECSVGMLTHYELGNRKLSLEAAYQFSRGLGVSMDVLLKGVHFER